MSERRLAVHFYHRDRPGDQVQWLWTDAITPPIIGDFVVTPKGSQWMVLARTWVEPDRCNVVVADRSISTRDNET